LGLRPVVLISHIVKIYERILGSAMVKYLEDNKILCDNQHGFRSGRNCLTKAFDKVDHRLLIEKLKKYGFNGNSTMVEVVPHKPPSAVCSQWHVVLCCPHS
jgi:hypothetical protein